MASEASSVGKCRAEGRPPASEITPGRSATAKSSRMAEDVMRRAAPEGAVVALSWSIEAQCDISGPWKTDPLRAKWPGRGSCDAS